MEVDANEYRRKNRQSINSGRASKKYQIKVLNGLPMMRQNDMFDKYFKIFERVGWDDTVGATYLAVDVRTNTEVVLRIDRKNKPSVVKAENIFLTKVDIPQSDVFFPQLKNSGVYKEFFYYVAKYKNGPSLEDCINFMRDKKMSHGTAARLACDILRILEAIHKAGYLLRSLHPNMFFFDAVSRKLCLSDLSTIARDVSRLSGRIVNRWRGGIQYAPLTHHKERPLSSRDELEALFYLLIEMVKGFLPWGTVHASLVEQIKLDTIKTANLFFQLPRQYAELHGEIQKLEPNTPIDYNYFAGLLQTIYTKVGCINDPNENFDFEEDSKDEESKSTVIAEKGPVPGKFNGQETQEAVLV